MSIFACLLSYGAWAETVPAQTWKRVKWVDDGDTILLRGGIRVRYIGINAPEVSHDDKPAEPYGDAAKTYNIQLVYRKRIRLAFDQKRKDRYGRLLAYVFLKDGRFINRILLQQGYAYCLFQTDNHAYSALFLKTQQDAMIAGRGIWRKWHAGAGDYVGNRRTRRFHLKGCRFARDISRKNRHLFKTKWDAFWAGYAPGKQCLEEYWKH